MSVDTLIAPSVDAEESSAHLRQYPAHMEYGGFGRENGILTHGHVFSEEEKSVAS